jgi:hypothetical protein
MELVAEIRPEINKDWATYCFLLSLALVTGSKYMASARFNDFLSILFTDKYISVYKDKSHLYSWFSMMLFTTQLLSYAFFIFLLLIYFGWVNASQWIAFIQIVNFLVFFSISKYLIDKIIATTFGIEEFAEQYNLYKLSYRSYIGMIMMPFLAIFFYADQISRIAFGVLIGLVLFLQLFTYVMMLRKFSKTITGLIFYFILYLCALEIAPYYFMYYWFTTI